MTLFDCKSNIVFWIFSRYITDKYEKMFNETTLAASFSMRGKWRIVFNDINGKI